MNTFFNIYLPIIIKDTEASSAQKMTINNSNLNFNNPNC